MAKPNTTKLSIFQRFGLFFFDRAKTTATLWLALIVFGVLSYSVFMQRQGFPNVEVPISVSSGTYFVNDKEKVDADIVKPLSEVIMKQTEVKTITANASDNFFSIVIQYKDGTNVSKTQQQIKTAAETAGFLPINANLEYKAINATKIDNENDVLLSVHQTTSSSTTDLVTAATQVAKDLEGTVGVQKINVLTPFKSGTNPVTGLPVTLQQTYDRVGLRENGKTTFYPSVEIGIVAKAGTDAIHLERSINERLAQLSAKELNQNVHVAISAGVAENIETQISNLQKNLIEGLVVVIIISLLLISWRAGLATAISMASVLLITVGVLYLLGITLNTITLFALVLCLGLIVDDTTIMAEAIDAGKRADATNREIVSGAMKKVARASTAGTLVTMLAFAPMLFISGILGSFIKVLPITIIISLAVSLLVSLTLIPFMSRFLLLSKKGKAGESRNPVLKLENAVSSGLAKLIRVGERSRKKGAVIGIVAILIGLMFLMGSGAFFQKLKFDIFPSTKDSDAIALTIKFPSGTTIEQSEKITDHANEIAAKALGDNLRDVTYVNSGSETDATAYVRLIGYTERDVKSPELVTQLTNAYKGFDEARVKVSQTDVGPPKDDLPFRVQVFGEDTAKTSKLAQAIADYMQGREVTRTSNKTTAKITRVQLTGEDSISRNDARRVIEVQAGFDSDDVSALVTSAQKTVEKEFTASKIASYGIKKSDVTFNFGSESDNQDSFKTMLVAFPVLFLVMYLLLALLFRSILQPLLIFTAIPFSFFGVAAGLHFTNNPLSFFVMIGFFALIGIAVNNTILLTDFANQARREGNGGFESMALAVKARFRPLITTSLTSVVALIPLALSDPFWESLAFTLIFGLLSSTFLVVVSYPYFYLGAELLRSRYSRRLTIAWIISIIAVIVIVSKIKASLVPYVFALAALIFLATYLKGVFLRRLAR